jgi:S-formylglutathione hydrolase FrmB
MKKYAIIFLSIIGALFIAQCSKRSNPVDTTSSQHGRYWTLYFRSDAIDNNVMDDPPYRNILVYTPPGYDPADTLAPVPTSIDTIIPAHDSAFIDSTGQPDTILVPTDTIFIYGDTLPGKYYPVLYLLHGYGGDENYFMGLYDVGEILDEMTTSGQIRPMIVATPNATNSLGGSFYTNSPDFGTGQSYAGRMQDFVTEEVTHVIDSVFNTIKDRRHRGIAGHSMGGYGAVKLAMLRNDLYGSASSMSGPVDFWGLGPADSTFLGLFSLMPVVFQENGFHPGNQAEFYGVEPGPGKRLTNMMFAMASAFSPHDPGNADTSFAHRFTTTQFEGKVDLPFDYEGNVALSVWDLWLANDVTSLFASGYGGVFDSTTLYLDAGSEDDLYLNVQTQIFNSIAHADQFEIYAGDPGHFKADHMSMIATRLRKVFKFHDEAFNR